MAQQGRIVERRKGQVFVVEGAPPETVYLLAQGDVRTFFAARRGRPEVTTSLLRAPARFGDVPALLRVSHSSTVEAATDALALAFEAQAYLRALQHEPAAAFAHYASAAQDLAGSGERERAALTGGLLERTVAILIAYADPQTHTVSLSQDDLAQFTGSTRRTIARVMARLYASGGLLRRGRRYVVVDPTALGRLPRGARELSGAGERSRGRAGHNL
jgi:CRP-like cAMP-binding protein